MFSLLKKTRQSNHLNYLINKHLKKQLIKKKIFGKIIQMFLKIQTYFQLFHFKRTITVKNDELILFIVPSTNKVSGGILSIFSIFKETRKLNNSLKQSILITKLPYYIGKEPFRSKITAFDNNIYLYNFSVVHIKFKKLKSIILHIPELHIPTFIEIHNSLWSKRELNWWYSIPNRHINILNQNILLMPERDKIEKLKKLCTHLTQTTAHDKYANSYYREFYNIPLHHLSVFINRPNFNSLNFNQKSNLIMISPDENEHKSEIVNLLKKKFNEFKFIEINGIRYNDYLEIAKFCKISITFGEGLDGYFFEPTIAGGIGFAVYNKDFFMPEYKKLPNVFETYEDMRINICQSIQDILSNENAYNQLNIRNRKILDSYYSHEGFLENLKKFYNGEYTYP